MAKAVRVGLAVALLVAAWVVPAFAGKTKIRPAYWATFNPADTNCTKATRTNAIGEPTVDVMRCADTGGVFQIPWVINSNANTTQGTGWNFEFQTMCDSCLDGEKACLQVSHIVCIAGEDCEDLAFQNPEPVNGIAIDIVTDDIGNLVIDTSADLTAALEHGAGVACTGSTCDLKSIIWKIERGDHGTCTDDLTGDLDFQIIISRWPED